MNNEDRNLIAKQHCNKLIAEFMGVHEIMHDGYSEYELPSNEIVQHLQYHTSWDWLMPVVEKCLTTGEGKIIYHGSREHYVINDALLTCNIEEVYKVVIEFINQYNNE